MHEMLTVSVQLHDLAESNRAARSLEQFGAPSDRGWMRRRHTAIRCIHSYVCMRLFGWVIVQCRVVRTTQLNVHGPTSYAQDNLSE